MASKFQAKVRQDESNLTDEEPGLGRNEVKVIINYNTRV